ncbi:N-6 DNA methylase [Thalassotalea sediminis]|uniref:N-6 DNA methylase n=1 Tax=Thalassotalea sediminis TaxID=1759089 RepID=UPI0025726433|nr:N-6 DNA methylase [Thalassotalea sediminis]
MNKQIWSVINGYRGKLSGKVFIEVFAGCSAWLKLLSDGELDDEHKFTGEETKEQLAKVLNDCVDVNFTQYQWDIKGSELTELVTSLKKLLDAKAVSFTDLSCAIKELQNGEGKGGFSVPDELAELGSRLIGENVKSVYCPFSRGVDFAMQWPSSVEKCGESLVDLDVFLSEVHSVLLNNNFHTVNINPIYSPYYLGEGGLKQFDASIAIPPMGMKLKSEEISDIWGRFPEKSLMGEVYFLRHMLAQTSGIAVCFVANGFLFRTAAGEKQFKQEMVNKNWIKAVIALPSNLLPHTGIPISILVMDKTKTSEQVKFIDGSSDVFIDKSSRTRNRLINIERIIEAYNSVESSDISVNAVPHDIFDNDFNLSPSRYVLSDESKEAKEYLSQFDTVKLADLVDIVRPQALKHTEDGSQFFYEFNLSSLDDIGFVHGEGKQIIVSQNDIAKATKQTIQPDDVLVVCKGAVGKVGYVDSDIGDNAIASQAFSVLRIKPHIQSINPEALYQYLTSKYGQQLILELATGTSAMMLSSKDLAAMPIPLFSAEKLNQIKEVRQQIIDTNQRIESLKNKIEVLNNSWL